MSSCNIDFKSILSCIHLLVSRVSQKSCYNSLIVFPDSLLSLSGRLDYRAGGLTIRKITQYDLGYQFKTNRRSIYVPRFRNSVLEIYRLFDAANPNMVVGHRNTSTLPTQSLYLMNSGFVLEQAQYVTMWLLSRPMLQTDSEYLDAVYMRLFNRLPSSTEKSRTLAYLDSFEAVSGENEREFNQRRWERTIHALIASLDFRYY